MDKNLIEWISILNECWEDTKQLLSPIRKAEKIVKENKALLQYMTLNEKIEFYNLSL